VLEKRGYEIVAAENGERASEIVREGGIDLVLMDVQMPKLDGLEAARRIRQMDGCRDLPIVALTAHAMRGDEDRCLAAGCTAYLAKPIHPDGLVALLGGLLGAPPTAQDAGEGPAAGAPSEPGVAATLALADELRESLLDSLERSIEELETALEINDMTAAGRVGEALARSPADAGLECLDRLARRIERAARQSDLESLPGLLDSLRTLHHRAKEIADAR
jgi:CheY-like chemotaxis protein